MYKNTNFATPLLFNYKIYLLASHRNSGMPMSSILVILTLIPDFVCHHIMTHVITELGGVNSAPELNFLA